MISISYNFSSNDFEFIEQCIREAKLISNDIHFSCVSKFFDGEEKDLLKLFIEGGWLVSLIGAAGMLARLITSPLKRADWLDYIKKIVVATITTTMAWFLIEQVELSSITKAITYGVIGVVSPELIQGLIKLAKSFSNNPRSLIDK